jgi:enoyl-CoA hydratase/carnithine racemase
VATRLNFLLVHKSHFDVPLLLLQAEDGYPRLERSVLDALETETQSLATAPSIKGAVIMGSDRAFAVGAEISELAALDRSAGFEFARRGQRAMNAVAHSRKRIVAAIRGFCFGGGLDLALACHARLCSDDAIFAHPGGGLGIITGWGGTQRLPRLIGASRAVEMFITGRRLNASEALACGLVDRIVPASRLWSEAIKEARRATSDPAENLPSPD